MKTLLIFAHPNIQDSQVNKRWLAELEKYPNEFTIHKLYEIYPDEKINVLQEQALVEAHDSVTLQFPIYWFNCPPLMKKWLDEVLLYGWAYGSGGDKFTQRNIALAVTAGISQQDYASNGVYLHSLDEVLLPFKMTADYIQANYRGYTAFYGAEHELTDDRIENSVEEYIAFMRDI